MTYLTRNVPVVSYLRTNFEVFAAEVDWNRINRLLSLDSTSGFKLLPQSLSPITVVVVFSPSYNCNDASIQSVVAGTSKESNFNRTDLSSGVEILSAQIYIGGIPYVCDNWTNYLWLVRNRIACENFVKCSYCMRPKFKPF